jgi:hypothetical protein
VDINRAWQSLRETIKSLRQKSLGCHELTQHTPQYDEECTKLLDQRRQTKLKWLVDPSEKNGNNQNNVKM